MCSHVPVRRNSVENKWDYIEMMASINMHMFGLIILGVWRVVEKKLSQNLSLHKVIYFLFIHDVDCQNWSYL